MLSPSFTPKKYIISKTKKRTSNQIHDYQFHKYSIYSKFHFPFAKLWLATPQKYVTKFQKQH